MTGSQERLHHTLEGRETDRPPYGFWTHFPEIDRIPAQLAVATAEFARRYQLDFVKAMSNGFFFTEDWGAQLDFSDIAKGGTGRVTASPVQHAADWARITRMMPAAPALARELEHLRRVIALLGPEVPVVATVISPLTVARKLAGPALDAHLSTDPDLVLHALEEIAATVRDFCRAAIDLGCAGVFMIVQDATSALGEAQYLRFGAPFDLIAWQGAAAGWFNIVHMHGDDILFDLLASYPVQALNWHIGETAPTLAGYRAAGGSRPVVGGLRRMPITRDERAEVARDLAAARAQPGVIITPGCVVRHPLNHRLLGDLAAAIRSGHDLAPAPSP